MHATKTFRSAAAGILLVGTMGFTLTVGGVADAKPQTPDHGAHQNGCTLSPDSGSFPTYYNFHDACDNHDLCYYNKPYGKDASGRKACDDEFHRIMRGWCDFRYGSGWRHSACHKVAGMYYAGVRSFGEPYF